MDSIRFQELTGVPASPHGYSITSRSVANDGSLLFLSVEQAGADEVTETYAQGIGVFPKPKLKRPRRFRLSILRADESLREIELPEIDETFPLVDILPNGKVLVAGARSAWRSKDDYDLNGIVFDPNTNQTSRILLGDGINSAYTDALGRIWVAYFDEGISGNFGWGSPGPTPVGACGLVCFSEAGEKLWEYPATALIGDCSAMNISGPEAAICYDPPYTLSKISGEFAVARWKMDLPGTWWREFAISDDRVLVWGQRRKPDADVFYAGNLVADELTNLEQVRPQLPDGSEIAPGRLLGRGKHLYLFGADRVYRASLD